MTRIVKCATNAEPLHLRQCGSRFNSTVGELLALRLDGKVAVITGGSSGLGLATARRFVEEGAFVFITGRRQKELDEAVGSIGRNIRAVQGDMAVLDDIRRLYATVQKEKGKIDVVFANAGTGAFAPLGQITEQHFDAQFDINVKGLLFTVQEALPLLRDGGAVVLNASIVSVTGSAAMSVYSASKSAVRSFALPLVRRSEGQADSRERNQPRARTDTGLQH
jgi:NAD(P)-dependent dehydrogenase (short-subunit alcohol dehydrogenase family)